MPGNGCGSRARRWLLLALAAGHVLVVSGVVYGWTALRPILQHSGYLDAGGPEAQGRALGIVATAGIAANALVKLPLGVVMDVFGPRVTALAGCAMMVAGALALALGDKKSLVTVGGGYFLLGAAGPFVQMPTFPFSAAFPASRAAVLSLLITCFELSTGVFVAFNELFFRARVPVETMFLAYAGVGVAMAASAGALWPDCAEEVEVGKGDWDGEAGHPQAGLQPTSGVETIPAARESGEGGAPAAAGARKAEVAVLEEEEGTGSEGVGALWELPWWRQMATPEFVYVAAFLAVHVFRQGFTLTTMLIQLTDAFPGNDHLACTMADIFSLFLPLGFLPILLFTTSGANAYLLNRPSLSFLVATAVSMAWGLLFLTPSVPAFIAIFILFPVARQFVYSTFFAYAVSVFGYQSFGRISGMACTLAGAVQFAQVPLIGVLKTGSGALRWWHVNAALGAAPALLLLPIAWEWAGGRCGWDGGLQLRGDPCDPERQESVLAPLASEGRGGADGEGEVDDVPQLGHFGRTPSSHSLAMLRVKMANGSTPMDVPNFGGWQMCVSMADSLASSLGAYSSWTSPQPGSLMGHTATQGSSFTTSLYGNYAAPRLCDTGSPPPSPTD